MDKIINGNDGLNGKNNFSQRSCSAFQSRAAGRNSKVSLIGNLTNLESIRQSVTVTDFLHDILNKKISEEKIKSTTSQAVPENIIQNEVVSPNDESTCPSCKILDDDFTTYVIQELEFKLQELKLQLIKEKNGGQILRKDIFKAKKVVEKEIAGNTQDFETLLGKANNRSWKGRQEITFVLKRQLRRLNEIIESLSERTNTLLFRKKLNPQTEELTEIITDDRKVRHCLELERKEVSKNMERYRQNFVASRDVMKKRLKRLTEKAERKEEEVRIIRKKLSVSPKQIDEELIQRFHDIQNELKAKFKEKDDESRAIDTLEQEFSQNSMIKKGLITALAAAKQTLKEKEEKVRSLTDEKTKLQTVSENFKNEKIIEAQIRKKELEGVENGFDEIVIKSENLLAQLTDSKRRLEKMRKLQLKKSSISIVRKSLSTFSVKIMNEHMAYQYGKGDDSKLKLFTEIPDNQTRAYKNKLLMYQSIFYALQERNENKLRTVADLINGTKEWTFDLLENRCLMWETASDIKTLKKQNKKLMKSVLCSTKQNFAKKKSSSLQVMDVLNERKTYLAIQKKENQCLKSLIRYVLSIKDDDCNVLQSLLMKNKDGFLKESTRIKL